MKIAILSMGGTILSRSDSRLDFKDYSVGFYTVNELLENIPEIRDYAEITIEHLQNIDSSDINVGHWITLKEKVDCFLNKLNYDGVVIPHGTDTLEETAYFLHLTVNSSKPVVIVGAQRPFFALSSDAGINLLNAVRVATNPASYNQGVLVMLNDEINSAREATKTNTYRLETFQSGQMGLLGYVDVDNTVQFYRNPTRKHTANSVFSKIKLEGLPEVAIVYSYAGASGNIIDMIVGCKSYQGIVIAGKGGGMFSRSEKEALKCAVDNGITVVRSSRVGNGRVVELKQYRDLGFIWADNLNPQKARILLMLALKKEKDLGKIQEFFNEY